MWTGVGKNDIDWNGTMFAKKFVGDGSSLTGLSFQPLENQRLSTTNSPTFVNVTTTGKFVAAAGLVSAPTYNFSANAGTGFWHTGTTTNSRIEVAINGANVGHFLNTGWEMESANSLSWNNRGGISYGSTSTMRFSSASGNFTRMILGENNGTGYSLEFGSNTITLGNGTGTTTKRSLVADNITAAGTLSGNSLTLTTPYNPFDQSLNTTDSVTFGGVQTTNFNLTNGVTMVYDGAYSPRILFDATFDASTGGNAMVVEYGEHITGLTDNQSLSIFQVGKSGDYGLQMVGYSTGYDYATYGSYIEDVYGLSNVFSGTDMGRSWVLASNNGGSWLIKADNEISFATGGSQSMKLDGSGNLQTRGSLTAIELSLDNASIDASGNGTFASLNYTDNSGGANWATTTPTTIDDAINRIASCLAGLNGSPIP